MVEAGALDASLPRELGRADIFYSGVFHWCTYDDAVHTSQVILTLGKGHSQGLGAERLTCPRLTEVGHWTHLRNVECIDVHVCN